MYVICREHFKRVHMHNTAFTTYFACPPCTDASNPSSLCPRSFEMATWGTEAHVITTRLHTQFRSHTRFGSYNFVRTRTRDHTYTRTRYSYVQHLYNERQYSSRVSHTTHASVFNSTREWHACPSHSFVDLQLGATVGHMISDQWNSPKFVAHVQCMHLLHLSLSSLIEQWTHEFVCWPAGLCYKTPGKSYTSSEVRLLYLAIEHVWKGQTFLTKHILQPTGPRVFTLSLKTKQK